MSLLLECIACFAGVWAFAWLFHAPVKNCWGGGLTGTVGWIVYRVLMIHGVALALSTVTATVCLLTVARMLAVWHRVPATVFVVPGVFPLVPGAGLYYTAYYIMSNDMANASSKGVETITISLSLAIGILIGNAIPQRWFKKVDLLRREEKTAN